MTDKPYSQPCENNKQVILDCLKHEFNGLNNVLEVGSGSGQHAVFFAPNLPHLQWHCSDMQEYHAGINQWIDEYPSNNLHRPFTLKLARDEWAQTSPVTNCAFDGVYTANTAHIMLQHEIKTLMQSVARYLPKGGIFCQYGPFKVNGKFTSESNEAFHYKLLDSGRGGYRDIDELISWAGQLTLHKRIDMPANNMMLVWHKK